MIHPTAIIHPNALVDPSCEVGPYVVIDSNVRVGPRCKIGPHVHLTGHTDIGADNRFYTGCVIGEAPQDLKYRDQPTRLRIGASNVFREHVTIHRSAKLEEDTVIGSNNFLMANCHVGHNCQIGNHIIIANGALVAGHVTIHDRVFISGNCLLHQFVTVGTLALMQGGSGISKDLPPYMIARGDNHIAGLNIVGLRRAGITSAERLELKAAYHVLFRSGMTKRNAVAAAERQFSSPPARVLIDFVRASKRGVCADSGHANRPESD
ncbi:MAG: acyl-ACP--UDP-N-acetylglucosamine O-acyltransferase [Limisphaerales bacterium]